MSVTSGQRRYRVAVVGAAGMWGRNYLRAYAAHPRAEVVAIVDRARDRCQTLADHYGIPQVFHDVEDLLAVEVPDIVSVILPVESSPQVVIACAEAGVRAISCEKPIAVRLEEADRLALGLADEIPTGYVQAGRQPEQLHVEGIPADQLRVLVRPLNFT